MPRISVIIPFSRGIKELSQLLRDFKNQTLPPQDFEVIIVRDGKIPEDIQTYITAHEKEHPNVRFVWVRKDVGNMKVSPGTGPRNYGVTIAKGEFCYFFDDDDRARDSLLELLAGSHDNTIVCVQMSCSEARIYKNGNPDRTILIPEIGLSQFPVICHVGTPCYVVKREWALAEPWRHEPEHDYRFIKRICDRFQPIIQIAGGMQVDVDSKTIGNMRDFVSIPPFYRS